MTKIARMPRARKAAVNADGSYGRWLCRIARKP